MSTPTVDPTDPFEAIERAERRIAERARAREEQRVERERRRSGRPWLLRTLALPVAGAIALLAILEASGGDLRDWLGPLAGIVLALLLLAPAGAAGWRARERGGPWIAFWALAALSLELVLVFGVGFLVLGLGPR